MVHTEIAVRSHVSDTPDYVDNLIDDLHQALQKAEAAMDKLRDTSKLQVSHRVQAMQAKPESFAVSGIGIGRYSQVAISSSPGIDTEVRSGTTVVDCLGNHRGIGSTCLSTTADRRELVYYHQRDLGSGGRCHLVAR
jgi:hypothetical protein